MGNHELRHNIPCFIKDISCGRECNRQLADCSHKCIKSKLLKEYLFKLQLINSNIKFATKNKHAKLITTNAYNYAIKIDRIVSINALNHVTVAYHVQTQFVKQLFK